jgi:hypothetical protein
MEDQLLALDEGPEGHVDERREVRGWHSRALPPQTLARYPESHDPTQLRSRTVVTLRNTEREGYRGRHGAALARSRSVTPFLRIQTEERLGSLIAASGVVWGVHEATKGLADIWRFTISPPGPLEVCAIGILIWLHAKWRRSVKID